MADTSPITRGLLAAIMHSTEPMVLSDPNLPDNPMVAVNRAFLDLTGYDRAEIIGRNCRFLQGPKTDPETPRRIGAFLREGHGCIEWIVNYRRDGAAFWNLLFISPVFDAAGKLLHFFGNQQDITKGSPDWLGDYSLGKAHRSPAIDAEFNRLLCDMGDEASGGVGVAAEHSRSLERLLANARRIADVTTRLTPGGADGSR